MPDIVKTRPVGKAGAHVDYGNTTLSIAAQMSSYPPGA